MHHCWLRTRWVDAPLLKAGSGSGSAANHLRRLPSYCGAGSERRFETQQLHQSFEFEQRR
jgi:hypothetical protein